MGSLFLYIVATLIALAALGYWTPAWGQLRDFAGRVWSTFKDWRSVRAYLLAFAIVLFAAGAFSARTIVFGSTPDGSRESVYAAVREFQSKNHLAVDGVVGPVTFSKLYPRR